MNKFRNNEGLTLIELLITLAVIAIVFAVAVPVFSNVLAGAQTSADSAQASALSAFHDEYASTDLVFANGVTTATLNGVQIASIKGDATSAGGNTTPALPTYSVANNDFGPYPVMFGMPPVPSSVYTANGNQGSIVFGAPTPAVVAAVKSLAVGDYVTVNGVLATVRTELTMNGYQSYEDNVSSSNNIRLWVTGNIGTGSLTTFMAGGVTPPPAAPGSTTTYLTGQMNSADNKFTDTNGMGMSPQISNMSAPPTLSIKVLDSALKTKLAALTSGSTLTLTGRSMMDMSDSTNTYHVTSVTVTTVTDSMMGTSYDRAVITFSDSFMSSFTVKSITI
jgi:prepilin-type N-terminal cleavage/methylation domain-containing protein